MGIDLGGDVLISLIVIGVHFDLDLVAGKIPILSDSFFVRRQFQMHFLEWIYIDFDQNFTDIYSPGDKQLSEPMMILLLTHICGEPSLYPLLAYR